MAKKTAEKKPVTKKPRRRLKRTARRSLAAVLMITAVVVAAIPVPENVAADPNEIAKITARAADVHTEALADFKYDAKGKEISNIQTAQWAKENLNEFVTEEDGVSSLNEKAIWDSYNKKSSTKKAVDASLTVRDIEGVDTLTWQFLFYDVDIDNAGINASGTREVICMYNGEFTIDGIEIPLILNTEYYTVEESVISNYFKGVRPDGTALNSTDTSAASWDDYVDVWPDKEYKYTLDTYQSSLRPNNIPSETLKFFTDYFADDDDLQNLNAIYQKYLDSYDEKTSTYDETLYDATKDFLVKHPMDIKNADDQINFYCAHDNELRWQAEPYTLVAVRDQRPNKSGTIYVAKGGKPGSIKPYYNDDNGYLVKKQCKNLVCGIGACTFAGSDRIRNLELSSMINFIGDHAFEKASLISSIDIESASFIGNQAFKGCGELKTVKIGFGTNTIGAECFYGTKVSSIVLPNTIRNIGYGAFAHCEQLTTLDINTISQDCRIDGYAFYECPALTTVSMKDAQVISIGDGAFACTGGAKLDFTFPKGMTSDGGVNSIGDFMFAGRTNLNSVVFPEKYGATSAASVELPSNMFHECISLSNVIFPNEDRDFDCGYVSYDKDKLFADVANEKFYVQGPKMRTLQDVAMPRRTTWSAVMAIEGNPIPYLYIENGKEYYEVSNGDYLYCVDPEGIITSCTLNPDADLDMIKDKGIDLEIVSQVGTRKVTGLKKGCFTDQNLNQNVKSLTISDDSLSLIDEDVFKGWKRLQKVRIGDSVKEIGARAFEECDKLVDVTFSSPKGFAHKDFKIGEDAFKTDSTSLTFHGDIVQGYAPFDWAMDPDNIIDKDRKDSDGNSVSEGIRVCYKSMAPTFITVMYNPITEMVTMVDYPKVDQVQTILSDLHGGGDYNRYRENVLYDFYRDSRYDGNREAFANAWKAADTKEKQDAVYASENYGPWVNPTFVGAWESYVTQTVVPTPPSTGDEDNTGGDENAGGDDTAAGMMDWLFEPLTVYAADENPENHEDPDAYYAHKGNEYDVLLSRDERGKYRPSTPEEDYLLNAIENIVVPEGVQSIDVYGFIKDLDEHGEEYQSKDKTNSGNVSRYFTDPGSNNKWDADTEKMYSINSVFTSADGESSTVKSVAGLFSGYYVEQGEDNPRGNDTIRTVTMNNVKYLPNYAFDNCEKLQTVILGKDCADIGVAPFRGCKALRSVSNNDYYETDNGIIYSKDTDGSYVIEECFASRGDLEIVGQPTVSLSHDPKLATVTAIKPGAFEDCDVINMVLFGAYSPDGLTKIPENCFKDCDSLQEITLPSNVNDIEKGAFAGSNGLTKLTIYGKEVKISGQAFNDDQKKQWTTVKSYEDSAVTRYVKEYGTPFKLQMDEEKLGELWEVTYVGPDYAILDNLVDQNGDKISNPQYVQNGLPAKVPKNPEMEGWTFDKWVGLNGTELGGNIYEDTIYFAQGYSNSGMVNGKYVVNYIDSVDGTTFATEYVAPGSDAPDLRAPIHQGYEFEKWNGELTNIRTNTNLVAMYKVVGGANTSGGTTNTSGGATNTSGGTTNTSGGTTSNKSTSSSTSSSSTSTSSTTSADSRAVSMHRVTVVGGSGSGTYATGATVVISANEPAAGMKFTGWTTESSGVTLNQMTASSTMFVMPENDVLVVANFEGGTAAVPVGAPAVVPTSNNNDQTQDNGNTRVDITKPGISNKDLATANVNGSSDNFIIKISETDEATRAVSAALTNKYGTLDNILYYAMDITLWDATGSYQLTGDQLNGISVDITIPIPDSLVAYGGNNKAGAVINGDQLEGLNENFTTINGVPCIRFHATHFSPYTIYVDTGNLVEGMLDTTPKTGDPIHPKWFLSLGLACLSIILFMKKDRRAAVKA